MFSTIKTIVRETKVSANKVAIHVQEKSGRKISPLAKLFAYVVLGFLISGSHFSRSLTTRLNRITACLQKI